VSDKKIISRKEAIAQGLKFYDGMECKFGHGNSRYTSNGCCVICDSERHKKSYSARPWSHIIRGAKTRSDKSSQQFNLDDDWAEMTYSGVCAITGAELVSGPSIRSWTGPNPLSPSIDRIDPSKGYTKNNCRWVCHWVNSAKLSMSDEEFKQALKSIIPFANS